MKFTVLIGFYLIMILWASISLFITFVDRRSLFIIRNIQHSIFYSAY